MPLEPLQAGDPTRVGGYKLTARLGAGAMGVVFLGVADDTATIQLDDTPGRRPAPGLPGPAASPTAPRLAGGDPAAAGDGRLVAVKLIHQRIAAAADYRARFRREVAAARAVAGVCAARVLAADPDAPRPWLATEYIPGPTLAEAVGLGGPLSAPTVEALAVGLAEALVAIHRAGIVHRDLKPANVLITAAGPKVIDFGMAVPTNPAAGTEVTQTGAVVGSPGYLAPEQAEGRRAGPAADVWAWALTVAFAATGRPPFGTGTAGALLYRSMTIEPDLAGVPPRLLAVVRSALRRDPPARPSATRLLASLVGDTADPAAAAARVLEVLWQPPASVPGTPGGAAPARPAPTPASPWPAGPPTPVPPAAGEWGSPGTRPDTAGGQHWFPPPTPDAYPTPGTTPQPAHTPAPTGHGERPAALGGPLAVLAPPAPARRPAPPRRGRFVATVAAALLASGLAGAGITAAVTSAGNSPTPGPTPTATATTPAASPAPQGAGIPGAGDTELLAGRFTGTYTCQQGATALQLTIFDMPEAPGRVTALFSFSATKDNPDVPSGAYTMDGTLQGDDLELTGRIWLDHPVGYIMVRLSGTSSTDGQHLQGQVLGASCTTFAVSKTPVTSVG
ncbi:serine/threonine-protein kinase [Pseudofrankia sp. BMG5.37]|uniref:serine/threonine-protein kinase n=1 Tax=Pseudofrankia sp. BMG5.37 TaxID=3050035 RepID=UPI0028938FF7|nr:serine/threonine-protein kinase [Pseudofrankia sp. BMG5.37]MDT3441676.1 serine/threonine-protein kinase [Pseudofrankia sp. BMG5.37]